MPHGGREGSVMDDRVGLPPTDLIAHSTGCVDPDEYREHGATFFGYFKDLCGLRPTDRVLDMGCGCARMALPMVDYLTA
jgi:hypothetical protein